jgi:hypothetical protein
MGVLERAIYNVWEFESVSCFKDRVSYIREVGTPKVEKLLTLRSIWSNSHLYHMRCISGWCADEMVRIRRRILRGEIERGFRRKVRGSPNHLVKMQRVLLKVWPVTMTDEHRLSTCQ